MRQTYMYIKTDLQYIAYQYYTEVWILAPDLGPHLLFVSWAIY